MIQLRNHFPGIQISDFCCALGIAKMLTASIASPVLRIALLGTGRSFRRGMGQCMAGCGNDRIGKYDFCLTIGIAEIFSTRSASPVLRIALLDTGRGFRRGMGQCMAGCGNDRIGKYDFCLTIGIAEIFSTRSASPVLRITVLGAGGGFRFGLHRIVSEHRACFFTGICLAATVAFCRFCSVCRTGSIVVVHIVCEAVIIRVDVAVLPSAVVAHHRICTCSCSARMGVFADTDIFVIVKCAHCIGVKIHSRIIRRFCSFIKMYGG